MNDAYSLDETNERVQSLEYICRADESSYVYSADSWSIRSSRKINEVNWFERKSYVQ